MPENILLYIIIRVLFRLHASTIHKLPPIAETSFIPGSQQDDLYNKMAGQKRCTRYIL